MTEMRDRHDALQTPPYTVVAAKVSRESSKKDATSTAVAIVPRKAKLISAVQQTRTATLALAKNTQDNTVAIVKNPHFQVVTVSTAGGSVSLAAVGGAFGCMGGLVVGAMVGTVPALLTFGTSIPFGAVVGGALGAPAGACVAGVAGGAAGGLAGHGAYVWRAEIKGGVLRIKVATTQKVKQVSLALTTATDSTRAFTVDRATKTRAFASAKALHAQAFTTQKGKQASELALATKRRSYETVTDKRFQVTTASAAGGAVVGGTAGGAVGTVAGAGTGALVGLPAAIFTFGLSIPVCATIGGGIGCVTGATTGGTAGGVAGGATGYHAHKYRKEIAGGAQSAWSKVRNGTNKLKVKAQDSVAQVSAQVKARMVSGTGGTAV